MAHALIERVQREGSPLMDGRQATFIWRGKDAPSLVGDFNDWEETQALPFKKVSHHVWTASLELPLDAYIEYRMVRGHESFEDPFNPRVCPNGLGDYNNFFYMPEGSASLLRQPLKNRPRGKISRLQVGSEDILVRHSRTVYLYQPPTEEPCPLVVVWDGREYLRLAKLANIVDNLIDQQRIRPIALALVPNAGKARTAEFSCSEAILAFITLRLLPQIGDHLNLLSLSEHPGAYASLGASLGGLLSLYVSLRLPDIFGSLISQSGAFTLYGFDSVVYPLASAAGNLPAQVWFDVGVYEDLLETNLRMSELLRSRGCDVGYNEYPAGHNYTAWGNTVWRGLEALFPVIRKTS